MRWLAKERFRVGFLKGQSGFTLIETVIAVGILAAIGVAVVSALDTNSRANRTLDEQTTGVNLATAHLEAIGALPFSDGSDNYSSARDGIDVPSQYKVDIDVYYSDDGTIWGDDPIGKTLQLITIIVSRDGGKPVLSMCTYKYN